MRLNGISTGSSNRATAETFATDYIVKGKLVGRSKLRFSNFAKDFFVWETSSFIKQKLKTGHRYSPTVADANQRLLEKHVMPVFKDFWLEEIHASDLETFRDSLMDYLANPSVNNVMNTLKSVLNEAYRLELIKSNPADRIKKLINNSRPKGTFIEDWINRLFNPALKEQLWKGKEGIYLINLIAATTGMRQGEILALRRKSIKDGYIDINATWTQKHGLKPPKYDSYRLVCFPKCLSKELLSYLNVFVDKEDDAFLFQGRIKGKPIDHQVVNDGLYYAMKQLEIDDEQRAKLNITFHSWRHTLTTMLRNKVPDAELMLLTGHKETKMLDNYTHAGIEVIKNVALLQDEIFKHYSFGAYDTASGSSTSVELNPQIKASTDLNYRPAVA
jgi:integrase